MKNVLIANICLLLCGGVLAAEEGEFTPRLAVNHKGFVDEALAHLLKERPEVKAENLAFSSLDYHYQPMPATTAECDAQGCRTVPAAPFQERLMVNFTVLDSKRKERIDGVNYEVHDMLSVQFPTPRMPEWFISQGKSQALIDEGRKE